MAKTENEHIKDFIKNKTLEMDKWIALYVGIEKLDSIVPLKKETLKEVREKINDRIDKCQHSILIKEALL